MHQYTCFIFIFILILIPVSGVSALPGPDAWRQMGNGSFTALTEAEVAGIVQPVIEDGTE